ncbi:PKD domain-containing protein [Streptacidiphilus sp. EB103A]|uniref:PKD domain-containing protein n=1 Tax=Streptacidiphilus sp. EB103A TaxID=3156275 RepID=UPI0035150B0F
MPRRTRALIATTAAALLLGGLGTSTARADGSVTDLYVDNASTVCTDAGSGSQAAPYCSVQTAVDAALPGQTVHVLSNMNVDGDKPVVITHSGDPGKPITLDGVQNLPRSAMLHPSTGPALILSGAHDIVLHNLRLSSTDADALEISGSHSISVDNVWAVSQLTAPASSTASADAVVIDGASGSVTFERSVATAHSGTVVDVRSGATDVTIASDLFPSTSKTSVGGVHADGVNGIRLAGNTFSLECGYAVDVTGVSTGSIENTVIQDELPAASASNYCATPQATVGISVSPDSTAGVRSDYNAVQEGPTGTDYDWGGTTYTSSSAFSAATGQGSHDLDQFPFVSGTPAEHSPLIDSGDQNAPGEASTDRMGNARIDDPLVPNTGTGAGYVDRGAFEFQDPYSLSVASNLSQGPAPLKVTATAVESNPWNVKAAFSFDFGDGGAAVQSSSPTATYTYTRAGSSKYGIAVTATLPDGSQHSPWPPAEVSVLPPGPLSAYVNPVNEDHTATGFSLEVASPWPITSQYLDFGDHSGVQLPVNSGYVPPHVYPKPGPYTATLTVTDQGGRRTTATCEVVVGTSFVGLAPHRVLDTRSGTGAPKRKAGPGSVLRLKIAGVDGIPTSGVAAVTMNVTDTNASAASWIAAYPDGVARPTASNLNFLAGQTNPNEVTVAVGADGYVDLYNANGNVDILADVQGYYTATPSGSSPISGLFTPTAPTRVLDTRKGTGAPARAVGPNSSITVSVGDLLPADATAVVVSVTATSATADSWVAAYPSTGARPTASNLNFQAGQTTSNQVVVPVDSSRQIRLYNQAGRTALIADVEGYFSPNGAWYVPVGPMRLVDTRYGIGEKWPLPANATLPVYVKGQHGIPWTATAAVVNITGTQATATTWLAASGNTNTPNASVLNLSPGQTRPVLATSPIDGDWGAVEIYNSRGEVAVIADLEGYYAR